LSLTELLYQKVKKRKEYGILSGKLPIKGNFRDVNGNICPFNKDKNYRRVVSKKACIPG